MLWVNSAKGIGIILIILGHLLYSSNMPWLSQIIYSFHTPLFFILSGYIQKKETKPGFIRKRAKRLLIPYIAFSVIGIPYFGLRLFRQGLSFPEILSDFLYVNGEVSNHPLWFLVALFEIGAMIRIIRYPQRSTNVQILILLLFVFLGEWVYSFSQQFRYLRFFGLNKALVCSVFYMAGILIRKIRLPRNPWLIIIPSLILTVLFGTVLNSKISIYQFQLGTYWYFFVASLSGSLLVMHICRTWLDKECFLSKLSGYAILFLGFQYFIIIPFREEMGRLSLAKTGLYDIAMFVLCAVIVILLPLLYEWVKKKVGIVRVFNGEYGCFHQSTDVLPVSGKEEVNTSENRSGE